jgi:hypothetical protein
VLAVWGIGLVLGPDTVRPLSGESMAHDSVALWPTLWGWAADMAGLSLKILLIITALMIVMEILKQFRVIDKVVRIIEPFLGLLGLDRSVAILWLTAAVFGITYGGAVIVEETRERRIGADQLKTLHVSIGINHAMVEDPALFLPLGIHPFWLWIPRLVIAVVFTHCYRLWLLIRRRRRSVGARAPIGQGHV